MRYRDVNPVKPILMQVMELVDIYRDRAITELEQNGINWTPSKRGRGQQVCYNGMSIATVINDNVVPTSVRHLSDYEQSKLKECVAATVISLNGHSQ